MGELGNTVMDVLNTILGFAREGYGEVNAILGILIALVASFLLPDYRRILVFVVGATVVHLLAETLLPVVANGAAFRLPPILEIGFWRNGLVLLIGYFIVISIFYGLRKLLLRGG